MENKQIYQHASGFIYSVINVVSALPEDTHIMLQKQNLLGSAASAGSTLERITEKSGISTIYFQFEELEKHLGKSIFWVKYFQNEGYLNDITATQLLTDYKYILTLIHSVNKKVVSEISGNYRGEWLLDD